MINSPLIRPYLLGEVALGGRTLDSHEQRWLAGESKGFDRNNFPATIMVACLRSLKRTAKAPKR